MNMSFETIPALAERWRKPEAKGTLSALWREQGTVRLESALAPGLAAELHVSASRLPFEIAATHEGIMWRAELAVPPEPDPQLPEPFFRLVRLIETDLTFLIASVTNRNVRIGIPRRVPIVTYRKGSWTLECEEAPPGSVRCSIGISAGDWPIEWGGHDEWIDGSGALVVRRPPLADAIDLADATLRRRVSVLTHHVERIEVQVVLSPSVR